MNKNIFADWIHDGFFDNITFSKQNELTTSKEMESTTEFNTFYWTIISLASGLVTACLIILTILAVYIHHRISKPKPMIRGIQNRLHIYPHSLTREWQEMDSNASL